MRKVAPNRRAKKQQGCVGCGAGLFKFILFAAVLVAVGYFVSNSYFGSDIADRIRRTQYPIKYEYFVEKYSEKYELDKHLVYGVIRTESRFDKFAVSSADAKGLMQLTDETGRECANKVGISGYDESALFDPEINIQLGCYYLRTLINTYKNIDTALAAYNGGPGNVQKWLADSSYTDSDGNLVNIPFAETRNYVKRVNRATQMYKTIYSDDN